MGKRRAWHMPQGAIRVTRGRAALPAWLWRVTAIVLALQLAFGQPLAALASGGIALALEGSESAATEASEGDDAAAEDAGFAEEEAAEAEADENALDDPAFEAADAEAAEEAETEANATDAQDSSAGEGTADEAPAAPAADEADPAQDGYDTYPGQQDAPADADNAEGSLFAESENYEATVSFDASAQLPEGSELRLTELDESSAAYLEAQQLVLGGDADDAQMEAFDLSIVDAQGSVVEPAAPVQVTVVRKGLPEGLSAEEFEQTAVLTHLDESTGEAVPEVVASADADVPARVEVEGDQATATFEVASFSTYTYTWGGSRATVHYGYMSGGSFVEFANGTPAQTPTYNSSRASYLIYDVDGYQYAYTYRNTNTTANRIRPIINAGGRYVNANTGVPAALSSGDNIYVVYEPTPEPTPGGTVKPQLGTATPPQEPEVLKESEDNGDGTRTLSLSVTGHETPLEATKLADVIVVFDVSNSMNENMAGTGQGGTNSRLNIAKRAVNSVADILLAKTDSQGNKLVRMSLVSFSNTAAVAQGLTDDPTTFKAAVNGLSTTGGTNWEDALELANQMDIDPDRATFVIFVSDGNPTFRNTRGALSDTQLDINAQFYPQLGIFGTGAGDDNDRNYAAALTQAQFIVVQGKHFYTIAISNDVSNMERLNREAGGEGNYTATNATELNAAFDEIAATIAAYTGWANVKLVDGLTPLTNTTSKEAVGGAASDFTYWRKAADSDEWEEWDPAAAGANEATYNADTGAVEWDLGASFQLEDGVSYKVSFVVWPAQQALDYVTQLNGGEISFEDLSADVRDQIAEHVAADGTKTYTLKTNTDDAYVSYQASTRVSDDVTVSDDDPQRTAFGDVDPLTLDTMKLFLLKEWNDSETQDDSHENVTLTLQRRAVLRDGSTGEWEDFAIAYTAPDGSTVTSSDVTLGAGNGWAAEFYVSPGLMTSHNGNDTLYNPGYQYRLTEKDLPEGFSFDTEVVRPMLVNMQQTWEGATKNPQTLTGTNTRYSDIHLRKEVTGPAGVAIPADATFTFGGSVSDPEADVVWLAVADGDGTTVTDLVASSNVTAELDAGGQPTGRYQVPSGSSFSLTLHAGWDVTFDGLSLGATYTFDETDMTDGFLFERIATSVSGGSGTAASVSGTTATGTVDQLNRDYLVTYTNRCTTLDLTLRKTDTSGTQVSGATFRLERADGTVVAESISLGEQTLSDLTPGIYCLTETAASSGYERLEGPIYFRVGSDVELVDAGGNPTSYGMASVSTDASSGAITLAIQNTPGATLPSSGGSGTTLFGIGGVGLSMLAFLMYSLDISRRRRHGELPSDSPASLR